MPGQWILDDSQSLYYLDDEDVISMASEPIARPMQQQVPAKRPCPQERAKTLHMPYRRQIKITGPEMIPSAPAHGTEPDDRSKKAALQQSMITKDASLIRFNQATLFDQTFVQPRSGLNLVMGYNTSLPKSHLDVYITALRQLVRCCSEKCFLTNEMQRAVTAEGVLWVVREAWPAAEGYWNLTATFQGFLHAELWRNFPCERSYRQVPPAYRPTRAQLTIPHSPMIDWLPWPDVRDMAIRYQDQIDMDALFRMAIHNVVAHRKGLGRRKQSCRENLFGTSPKRIEEVNDETSFRVWDLVCLEKAKSTNPLAAEPSLQTKPVLRSPELRALSRAYDLEYDEFDTQKLDDCFFEAYPCLWADTATSDWKVKSFPNLQQVDVGRPVGLTRPAVSRLKSKIESLVGAEFEI